MKFRFTVEDGDLKYGFEADGLAQAEGLFQRIAICLRGPQFDPSKLVSQQAKQVVPHFSYLATSVTQRLRGRA